MSLRLLRIIRSMDGAGGGPVEGVRRQSELIHALGHRTTIATFDHPARLSPVDGAATIGLGSGLGTYGYLPGAIAGLRSLAEGHDVAIVEGLWQYHVHSARRALQGRLPYVVFPHGMLDPWFNRAYPLKAVKKRLYWRISEHRAVRDAAAVCFTTETERLLARTSFRPYSAREAVVGYGTSSAPPVDPGMLAAFHAACPQALGKPYLLFLSRIHEKKGCDLLISAFAAIAAARPELLLVVAGPDSAGCRARLLDQAIRAGIAQRVAWPGMLQGDAKWGAFYGAEAFCLPSHQENFGVAVAEALACGRPVLISEQVNIHHEISAAGAGLVAPDTGDGTIGLLRRWMGLSEAERNAMGASARRCFHERFEMRQAVEKLLVLLHRVVAGEFPRSWSPSR